MVGRLGAVGSDPEPQQGRCEAVVRGGAFRPHGGAQSLWGLPGWLEIRRPHSLKKQKAKPACLFICKKCTLWFFFFFFNR